MASYPTKCMPQSSDSLQLTFAGLDALSPCMIKLYVADISAVLEPSTPTSTAAKLARLFSSPALGACGTERF